MYKNKSQLIITFGITSSLLAEKYKKKVYEIF